ncbi:unnamed protein product, partial [Polarella glacialis]
ASTPPQLYATAKQALSQSQRLKAILSSSDAMRSLLGPQRADSLSAAIIMELHVETYQPNDYLLSEGHASDRCFIIDEGSADLLVSCAGSPPLKVCQYGPGSVFCEFALVDPTLRPGSIVATLPTRVWTLDRRSFDVILKSKSDSKGASGQPLMQSV